jgi:hypothetical protein
MFQPKPQRKRVRSGNIIKRRNTIFIRTGKTDIQGKQKNKKQFRIRNDDTAV